MYEGSLIPNLEISNEGKKKAIKKENSKPTFENVITGLPKDFHDEVIKMDTHLKSLSLLKFKRSVDKNGGKISWVASDYGISYHIEPSGGQLSHRFGWYIVYNGKPDIWHRKADHMEETLNRISRTQPKLAERIFYSLNDCVGLLWSGLPCKDII